jgi:hypothetical protein
MTKRELMAKYNELTEQKKVRLDGISANCNKSEIENAIACLECSDERLEEYLIVIKLKYPATYAKIANNGDFKRHFFNRLYVYNTARMVIAQ